MSEPKASLEYSLFKYFLADGVTPVRSLHLKLMNGGM